MNFSLELLWVPIFIALFLTIHEMGHVLAAKLLKLHLVKIGFTRKPMPHVFVEVEWPKKRNERLVFLLSGFTTIAILFTLFMVAGVYYWPLMLAFAFQVIFETNPIYSDFVILEINDRVRKEVAKSRKPYKLVYQKIYREYMYSPKWYLHFFLWAILILVVIKLTKPLFL
jgi:hypothetical protein